MRFADMKNYVVVLVTAGPAMVGGSLAQVGTAAPTHHVAVRPPAIIMLAKPHSPLPDAAQISNWINDLAPGHRAAQAPARAHLIAAGDAAAPALRKALHSAALTPLRQRLRTTLDGIIEADALRGPMVSLRAKSAALKAILEVVCEEAGMHASFPSVTPGLAQRLTVNVQQQPFWKVVQRIAKVTGISPASENDPPGFNFSRQGLFTGGSRVVMAGAFALVIRSARQISVYGREQTSGPGHRELLVRYCGLLVPTRHALVQIGPPIIRLAIDNTHRTLATPGKIIYPIYEAYNTSLMYGYPGKLTLDRASTKATLISKLRLALPIIISTGRQVDKTGGLQAGGAEIHFDQVHIKFGRPKRAGKQWDIAMDVSAPVAASGRLPVRALMSRLMAFPTPLMFRTAHGRLLNTPNGGGLGNLTHYAYNFNFNGGKPATVQLPVYNHVTGHILRFNFKDVPLLPH